MTDDTRPEVPEPSREIDQPELDDSTVETRSETEETLDDIRHERNEYRDLLLRKTAEFDNYRKRTDREREKIHQTAAFNLIQQLLPLVDDLERALAAEVYEGAVKAYRDGVELIHRQLLDTLTKRGVTPIECKDLDFDPHYHQAVAHERSEEHHEGQIIDEVRRGYMIGDRLLRATMVKVAKA